MAMKSRLRNLLIVSVMTFSTIPCAQSQLVTGNRGSDDVKIGVAGYTYRKYDLENTCKMLQDMGVKYLSIKAGVKPSCFEACLEAYRARISS